MKINQDDFVGCKEHAGSLVYAGTWGAPVDRKLVHTVRVMTLKDLPSRKMGNRIWVKWGSRKP